MCHVINEIWLDLTRVQMCRLKKRTNIVAGLENDDDDNNNGMNVLNICFGKGFWVKSSDRL